jgi:D-serine deaminase-like pyridoxal phosphate-dependent protein
MKKMIISTRMTNGMRCENDLPTPSLVIDAAVVERNLARMAEYCRARGLALRPHAKTHKSLHMARRQLAHGAVGLTVAKVGEAQALSGATRDLFVAYPALDQTRTHRLAELAGDSDLHVAVDSTMAIDALSSAARARGSVIGILVDLDVGYHRTGVQTVPATVELARRVAGQGGLRFDGLMIYPGHAGVPKDHVAAQMQEVAAIADDAVNQLRRAGLSPRVVSGGSTPTAFHSHLVPACTEIRPGTYIYNDWNTASAGYCALDDCAARVLCTVVSDAVSGKVVIDAGSKTLTSDRLMTDPQHGGFGHVVGFPYARVVRLSEEHGEIDVSRCPARPKLGQRVWVIPNHICPCVNLQDSAWLRHGAGELQSMRTDARGMLV